MQAPTPMATLDLEEQGTIQSSPLSFHESDFEEQPTLQPHTPMATLDSQEQGTIRSSPDSSHEAEVERRIAALARSESLGDDSNDESDVLDDDECDCYTFALAASAAGRDPLGEPSPVPPTPDMSKSRGTKRSWGSFENSFNGNADDEIPEVSEKDADDQVIELVSETEKEESQSPVYKVAAPCTPTLVITPKPKKHRITLRCPTLPRGWQRNDHLRQMAHALDLPAFQLPHTDAAEATAAAATLQDALGPQ